MFSKVTRCVRSEYWESERPSLREIFGIVGRVVQRGYERIRSFGETPSFYYIGKKPEKELKKKPEKELESKKKILDPQESFLLKWNKIFVLSCVIAVSVDPLFFYIPGIDDKNKCIRFDGRLKIIACVLRTFTDIFYILRIIFQFQTGFIAPSSRVFGRGELVDDPVAIAKRYLSTYFIVDVLSILPLPQFVVLVIIPKIERPVPLVTKEFLKMVILCQYVPRLARIYPLFREVTSSSGILTETAWAGAAYNLFLYMLASHVVGALWYLFSLDRLDTCWRGVFKKQRWDLNDMYCSQSQIHSPVFLDKRATLLNASCPFTDPDEVSDSFNFGMFTDALKAGVVESTAFSSKFFYCFWWGLRNLGSSGTNLETSTFVLEIIFAVLIAIGGLVLFSLLIGNMQKYLQSTTVRVEEMRVKRQDAEKWMAHRMLPETLRERIRKYGQYKWQQTRGVEEETLVRNLPKDLRRDIRRHLCFGLLRRVPLFEQMDDPLLDALCDRLKPALYTENSSIVREGDPVDEMLFIMRGTLATTTTYGGRTGFYNSVDLKAGDFCGEELLTWALDPNAAPSLPISTRTVVSKTEVEAFALMADDLKFVASQFQRLHSKQLQQTFRFYSQQWRSWAACFVQAAWRRYCKRKLDKLLREAEERLQDALANEDGINPSPGATIYASRFAANALRTLRQSAGSSSRPRLLHLMPQKPAEPDFTSETC